MKSSVDVKSFLVASAMMIAVVLFGFALWHSDGPMSRCEGAGGQMLVGPGGETSCIDGKTFVPMEHFVGSGKAN